VLERQAPSRAANPPGNAPPGSSAPPTAKRFRAPAVWAGDARLAAAAPVAVDVHLRSGVAGIRALGTAGLDPVAIGRTWGDAGLWSRHAAARAVVQGDGDNDRCFVDTLGRLSEQIGPVVPYPGMEPTIDLVVAAAAACGDVVAPFPPGPTGLLRQKSNLATLAREARIAVPRTTIVATPAELRGAPISFPCAVKSDHPVERLRGTRIVSSRAALQHLLDHLPPNRALLVQERLEGPLVCLALVVDREGVVVARFQHVAHMTWPAEAGPTARGVSVAPDADLVARSAQLLRAAGYWGLVELDFLPSREGPALIDANPRYYPAIALATACGVNLPAAWHRVVTGGPSAVPGPYQVGRSYRWLEADIVAALRGRPHRLRPADGGSATGAMWDAEDPLPAALLAGSAVASRPAKGGSTLARGLIARRRGRRPAGAAPGA
jgi:hypothetical protein